ncbi:MAG: hypothetical protein DA446_09325 [Bacteroidetes bacterium]|jgi:DNA-binding HxlR family transcriptional regulator|nr:MAG: hypothetical protein DA443_07665 [Bacteroidota bacterium]PTM18011.1 MAG: hypothetical protein DA446_09325 [Bacteroidota bacterium]
MALQLSQETLRTSCPLATSLDLVGDRWMMVILRDLFLGKNTFTEFLEAPEKISNTVLSDRLKRLHRIGLISYINDKNNRKIKHYYMTDHGVELYPVIFELMIWARKNMSFHYHEVAENFFASIEGRDRVDIIAEAKADYTRKRDELLAS